MSKRALRNNKNKFILNAIIFITCSLFIGTTSSSAETNTPSGLTGDLTDISTSDFRDDFQNDE